MRHTRYLSAYSINPLMCLIVEPLDNLIAIGKSTVTLVAVSDSPQPIVMALLSIATVVDGVYFTRFATTFN